MNEIKRYDQALADQLEHLPMPPEDMAWAEMKKMLEEEDDDPVVVPFFRRPGCLLPGLVAALLLLIGGWLYFKRDVAPVPVSEQLPAGNTNKTPGSADDSSKAGIQRNNKVDTSRATVTANDSAPTGPKTIEQNSGQAILSLTTGGQATNESGGESPVQKRMVKGKAAIKVTPSATANEEGRPKRIVQKKAGYSSYGPRTKARVVPPGTAEEEALTSSTATETEPGKEQVTDSRKIKMNLQPGVMDSSATKTNTGDSSKPVKKDSLPGKTTTVQQPQKEEKAPKKNQWQLAAGLNLYQPLPLSGEPIVPYNYYGRKGSLTDYIPAVHIRLYRTKKWFAHLEFRYGAPQSVKPFDYKQQIRDSAQAVYRTVYQLQKTYYHQVPFSFNYYVLPGLSVGGGIIYNHFTGAVAKKDVYRRLAIQDTLLSSSIIRDTAAGRVIKDHFQWSAEMQYQWKRLSIGARFSADIDPYIKFKDINTGAEVEKKMKALNVFLRFDLWRSKKWGR